MAREHQEIEANLWVGFARARDGRSRLVGAEQNTAARVISGEDVSVREGQN